MREVTCDLCEVTFVPEYDDDIYEDEAGIYHDSCHDQWIIDQKKKYYA